MPGFELGRTEDISVFVMRKGNPVPLITMLIKIPIEESVIVVLLFSLG